MATSVVTTTISAHHSTGKWDLIVGGFAIAAGDYTTGGLTVNFSNMEIKSMQVPVTGLVEGKSGYIYRYIAGLTKNIGKLMIFQVAACNQSAAPLSELPAAATPGAVVADTIWFFGWFPLLR